MSDKKRKVRWIGPDRYLPRLGITAHQGEVIEVSEAIADQYPTDMIGPNAKTTVKPYKPEPDPAAAETPEE